MVYTLPRREEFGVNILLMAFVCITVYVYNNRKPLCRLSVLYSAAEFFVESFHIAPVTISAQTVSRTVQGLAEDIRKCLCLRRNCPRGEMETRRVNNLRLEAI